MSRTISLAALILSVVLPPLPTRAQEAEKEGGSLEIGDAAPEFRLPGVDGKEWSLEDFGDARALVVVFTCNHCPTAQAYEERLKKLHADFAERGVALVAISPNDPEAVRLDELGYTDVGDTLEDMKVRAKDAKFEFPYLYDGEEQKVSRAYGPRATPHVFVFDDERKLRYSGRIDDSESGEEIESREARSAIEAVLAGEAVKVETTRTVGCSIKWSDKRSANAAYREEIAKEKVEVERISLEDVKKLRKNDTEKYVLVNLWATWCGPCLEEFPALVETYHMYRKRPFDFVAISLDFEESEKQLGRALDKFDASNRNYWYPEPKRDPFADALDESWSGALPLTILIAPGGKIVWRHEGKVDPLEMRRAIVEKLGRTYF